MRNLIITTDNPEPKLFGEWDNMKLITLVKKGEIKPVKVYDNKMYSIIYRLRKHSISIDTVARTIYYMDPEQIKRKGVLRLCNEFGFVRQSQFE